MTPTGNPSEKLRGDIANRIWQEFGVMFPLEDDIYAPYGDMGKIRGGLLNTAYWQGAGPNTEVHGLNEDKVKAFNRRWKLVPHWLLRVIGWPTLSRRIQHYIDSCVNDGREIKRSDYPFVWHAFLDFINWPVDIKGLSRWQLFRTGMWSVVCAAFNAVRLLGNFIVAPFNLLEFGLAAVTISLDEVAQALYSGGRNDNFNIAPLKGACALLLWIISVPFLLLQWQLRQIFSPVRASKETADGIAALLSDSFGYADGASQHYKPWIENAKKLIFGLSLLTSVFCYIGLATVALPLLQSWLTNVFPPLMNFIGNIANSDLARIIANGLTALRSWLGLSAISAAGVAAGTCIYVFTLTATFIGSLRLGATRAPSPQRANASEPASAQQDHHRDHFGGGKDNILRGQLSDNGERGAARSSASPPAAASTTANDSRCCCGLWYAIGCCRSQPELVSSPAATSPRHK